MPIFSLHLWLGRNFEQGRIFRPRTREHALFEPDFFHGDCSKTLFAQLSKKVGHLVSLPARPDPRYRDVRAKGTIFPPKAQGGQEFLHLLVDLLNLSPALVDPDPDYVDVVEIWEGACSFNLRCEAWKGELLKGGLDSGQSRRGDVSEKFQGEMDVLSLDRFQIPA
jgi:hypothetical protein